MIKLIATQLSLIQLADIQTYAKSQFLHLFGPSKLVHIPKGSGILNFNSEE